MCINFLFFNAFLKQISFYFFPSFLAPWHLFLIHCLFPSPPSSYSFITCLHACSSFVCLCITCSSLVHLHTIVCHFFTYAFIAYLHAHCLLITSSLTCHLSIWCHFFVYVLHVPHLHVTCSLFTHHLCLACSPMCHLLMYPPNMLLLAWRTPKLLVRLKYESKVKNSGKVRSSGHIPWLLAL